MKYIAFIRQYAPWVLLFVLIMMFIPWLGETLFNTKGEPREALVAMAMLDSGNWVLPATFGVEIPYKPPFLAWCIAACSWLMGGVTEFSSRMPSALATIALAMTTYWFFYRYGRSKRVAFVTALVLVTNVEVWRAASACRVDMLLTMCMVGAMYLLYAYFDGTRLRGWLAVGAVLLMTGAFLTKGPVGVFLPCMVIGFYRLLRGDGFWRLFLTIFALGVLSCLLPMLWYWAAYRQGGEEFLSLVLEENFGRLTGTMSYESHVNPWWYNVMTVTVGMLPYTLPALAALFVLPAVRNRLRGLTLRAAVYGVKNMRPERLLSLVTVVLIFIFYCIPASKRSVYLLPIYPFLSYFVALLLFKLLDTNARLLRWYDRLISVLAVLLPLVAAFLLPGCVGVPGALVAVACFLVGVAAVWVTARGNLSHSFAATLVATVAIYITLSAAMLPPILSSKSQLPVAQAIESDYPEGEIYSFMDERLTRFYEINYYLGNRLRVFDLEMPAEGVVLVGEKDLPSLRERFGNDYEFTPLKEYKKEPAMLSLRRLKPLHILGFKRSAPDTSVSGGEDIQD